MKKAIVIGSGLGGLAAALRLQNLGYQTTVFERLQQPGGRAGVQRMDGYTFDLGPTIITAPFLIEELFELHGKQFNNVLELKALDPWYQIRFGDGSKLPFRAELNTMKNELEQFSSGASAHYEAYLRDTREMFKIGFKQLSTEPFDSIWSMVRVLPDLLANKAYLSVWDSVQSYFDSSHLQQAFSFHPLLVGGNPLTASSIYRLIHGLEREWGVHYSMGGTTRIVHELVNLFKHQGGQIHYKTTIDEVLIERGKARGVSIQDGGTELSDLVVSNADPVTLYSEMVPETYAPGSLRGPTDYDQSMGLFVLYFGTNQTYSHLHHHEILLSSNYCQVLRKIFDHQQIPDELSMYLHRPSATDPDMAPEGHDAMYVLVPVPNLRGGQNWAEAGKRLQDRVIRRLEERVCPNLQENITTVFHRTPEDFKSEYMSFRGNGFSVQPILSQSAWFRFHNKSPIDDLYLVGAGTHPGAGVPGVLCSAKVVEQHVKEQSQ